MNSKIMLLYSDKTGQGHASIVQALKEQFSELHAETDIMVINGFNIGGPFGRFVEQLYFPLVKYAPFLWKLFFQLTSRFPVALDHITSIFIKKSFVRALREFKPDVIVTVHPAFVGSINNILERYDFNIPLIVMIADLVSISDLWADPRSSCFLSPTEEVKARLMATGLDEDRIIVSGFPVRKRFCMPKATGRTEIRDSKGKAPLNLLVFANAFSKNRTVSMIRRLLESFDCSITLLTGRDERLKRYIEHKLCRNAEGRLVLPGYVKDMERYMHMNDILITKAGPNTLMEAIHCAIPVIMTGNLPGQEEGTPEWIVKQGMGAMGYEIHTLIETIGLLLENDRLLLKKMADNQRNYKNRSAAFEIVNYISSYSSERDPYSKFVHLDMDDSKVPAV